jgi:hypothetical protein
LNFYSILFFLLIYQNCSSLLIGNRFELARRSDDFLVYYIKSKSQLVHSPNPIYQEKLSNFLKNIFYYKSNPIFSQKIYIFDTVKSEKIASILLDLRGSSDSLLLVFKREDPMAPYSRIYRTSIKVTFSMNSIKLEFMEIDKYFIFGNQYTFAEWSYIPEEFECNYKNNLFFNNSINYVLSVESQECKNNLYHDFIIYFNDIINPNKIKNNSKSIQERIMILEELLKNKVISDLEYQKLRGEILKNL